MLLLRIMLISLGLAGCAAAQPATQPSAPASAPDEAANPARLSVDQILQRLEERGQTLQAFTADVSLTTSDTAFGTSDARRGKIWYQNAPGATAHIRVMFDQLVRGGRIIPERVEYLLDPPWLTDRTYRTKTQVRRQVLQPGQQIDLLKLGEGPFPLPIGQPADEVKKQFKVEKITDAPEDEAPKDSLHVRLTPQPQTRLAKKFAAIDVWVDLKSFMPVRIDTMNPQQTSVQTTELTNVKINPQLTADDFKLPAIDANWTQLEEKYQE
jgi:hypothetical protein